MLPAVCRGLLLVLVLGLVFGGFVPQALAATAVLSGTNVAQDKHIDQQNANATLSGGALTTMTVRSHLQGGNGRNHRGLVQFSLASIPVGSQITSAQLELHLVTAPSATRTYSVHQVRQSWTELDASWNDADPSLAWQAGGGGVTGGAGGRFDTAALSTAASGTANGVWLIWDVTSAAQGWYTAPATNVGLLVKDDTEDSATSRTGTFATRENTDLDFNFNPARALKPRLVVTYTPPDLQITSLLVDANVASTDTVTVSMTVQNNGPAPVNNVRPLSAAFPTGLTFSGTATATAFSGPTPASVASLAAGATTTFTWQYTITGPLDATYAFTGDASSDEDTSPAVTTNTGRIADYKIEVVPIEVIALGSQVQVTFKITNGLISSSVDRVTIGNPDTGIFQFTDPAWGANDTTGWTQQLLPSNEYRFTSPSAPQDIQVAGLPGDSKTFTLTFSLIGNPGTDTGYVFPVAIKARGKPGDVVTSGSLTVRIPTLEVTSIAVDSSTVSGATVRVLMTVKNNGTSALSNVVPSPLTPTAGGTATAVLAAGSWPTPATIASLPGNSSASFEWRFTITGTVGQTYDFRTGASSNASAVTAPPVTSNTGSISTYGLSASPTTVTAGATLVQVALTVTNDTAGTVDRITVTNPNTTFWVTDATWPANDANGWTTSEPSADSYQFTSPALASDIPTSGVKTFIVTFATVGDPGLDTTYNFSVDIHRRGDAGGVVTTLIRQISVTRFALALKSGFPSPSTIPADGVTTSRITVVLTKSGVAQANETITFVAGAGAFGGLSSTTVTTDANGEAFVDLTSSVSKTNVNADVTASRTSFSVSTTVVFTGISVSGVGYLAATEGDGAVVLYWQAPTPYFTGALVVRKQGSAPTADPADGVAYAVGAVLAAGEEVVFNDNAASVGDTGLLANGTNYHYRVFTRYSTATPLYSTGTTIEVTPNRTGAGGQPSWSYRVAGATTFGMPLQHGVVGSRLYASVGNRVAALNLDGTQAWLSDAFGGDVKGWVLPWPKSGTFSWDTGDWAVYTLYFAATDGRVYALDPATGAISWQSAVLGDRIESTVAVQSWDLSDGNGDPTDQTVVPGGFRATFLDGNGGPMDVLFVSTKNASPSTNRLYALRAFADPTDPVTRPGGSVVWTFNDNVPAGDSETVDAGVRLPAVSLGASNEIYLPTNSNGGNQPSLWVLSALDGSLVDKVGALAKPPADLGDITADPVTSFDGTTLYVGTASGYVVALDAFDRSVRWTFSAGSPIVGFVWEDFTEPGTLYFSTQDGHVRRIRDDVTAATEVARTATPIAGVSTVLVDELGRKLWVGGTGGKVVQIAIDDIEFAIARFAVTGVKESTAAGSETPGDPSPIFDADFNVIGISFGTNGGRLYGLPTPLP